MNRNTFVIIPIRALNIYVNYLITWIESLSSQVIRINEKAYCSNPAKPMKTGFLRKQVSARPNDDGRPGGRSIHHLPASRSRKHQVRLIDEQTRALWGFIAEIQLPDSSKLTHICI